MSRDAALKAALLRLGGSIRGTVASLHNSATERERQMRARDLIGDLRQDLRYALRTLRRERGFTFFAVLGVHPLLGPNFTAEQSAWNGPKAALITYSLWRRRFNADPGIVGRPITLNGASTIVAGVLPPSFDFGSIFAPGARIDIFT